MDPTDLRSPWLVAAWPGMGGVAHIAGGYLVEKLGSRQVGELPAAGHFDVRAVEVAAGLIKPLSRPRGRFFAWRDPRGRQDLLIFLGDRQPDEHGYAYCESLIARAAAFGVTRVITFAAMASNVHPQAEPRVQVAATVPELLAVLRERGADALQDGKIAGLNGVLLAAAAAHEIEAACLLGEMPFFATQVPNPKASRAILRLFVEVAGIDLDLTTIDAHTDAVESQLVRHLEALQRASETTGEAAFRTIESSRSIADDAGSEPDVPLEVLARIEELFGQAARDRGRATELKEVLDRHGLFGRYEDRFLDLFRKAN